MIGLLVAGIGIVAGLVIVRMRRTNGSQPDTKALLALIRELFEVARTDGRPALERHAADWRASSIFRRYPSIANDAVVRSFLVDALLALVEHTSASHLDHQLSASLRLHRKKPLVGDKRDAKRREQTLERIRRSTLSMRRITGPLARKATTQDITTALARLPRPYVAPAPPASSASSPKP